jgi:hypothetical protein
MSCGRLVSCAGHAMRVFAHPVFDYLALPIATTKSLRNWRLVSLFQAPRSRRFVTAR